MALRELRRSVAAVVISGLVVGAAAFLWAGTETAFRLPERIQIGTASPGGAYAVPGKGLAAILNKEFGATRAVAEHTQGTVENGERLTAGDLEFAVVQSDARTRDDIMRVATLYEEVLHIVVNPHRFEELPKAIADLEGLLAARYDSLKGTLEPLENASSE